MLTKHERYQQLIDKATKTLQFFPKLGNQGKKSNSILQTKLILPSSYPFRSSQQIYSNLPITHQITHETSKQYTYNTPILLEHEWPLSCIGLILCQHHQNNQTFYVYGTGTLIKNNIVLTSAQNVYCRRLQKQYVNIKFIIGVNGNKCSGIYDIKQVHYPHEYTIQQGYENYDFGILQLYDDLSDICGYVGWKTSIKPANVNLIAYGYMIDEYDGYFKMEQIKKNQLELGQGSGRGVLMKGKESNYYIVGLNILSQTKQYNVLGEKMRIIVNSWISQTTIDLGYKNIGIQESIQLSKENWKYLSTINLYNNQINSQGCKYLSQAIWIYLSIIKLDNNNIDTQGCKHLSEANWKYLIKINLYNNNIKAQGCKYLTQANWNNLNTIDLGNNKIAAQGCKYLSQANWKNLTIINLNYNRINTQGYKYLCQANWIYLQKIHLRYTNPFNIMGKILLQQLWINAID